MVTVNTADATICRQFFQRGKEDAGGALLGGRVRGLAVDAQAEEQDGHGGSQDKGTDGKGDHQFHQSNAVIFAQVLHPALPPFSSGVESTVEISEERYLYSGETKK